MTDLTGKVALVTGAAQGIGAATVQRLAADGASVVALDLDASRAAQALVGPAADGLAVGADVTDRTAVDSAVARAVERFGSVDIVVNNAGITRDGLFYKMTGEDWAAVLGTHLTGAFHVTQAAQPHMARAGWGRVVMLSSRSALGNRGQANYAAAKAGLQGLTRTLAIELGPYGITVNAVAPGFIETAMTRAIVEKTGGSWDDLVRAATERAAVRRTGQPEDIAAVIAFLASPDSGFVTGQTIYATGGPTV